MDILLVTGSDSGVGKTHVAAALAQLFGRNGSSVQVVKVIEPEVKAKADSLGASIPYA